MAFARGLGHYGRMIMSLFSRRRPPSSTPSSTRIYAIGDIHGRLDLLEQLQAEIRRDSLDFRGQRLVVIHIGDYVDRGLESRKVIDRLLDAPLSGFESVFLRGNHEQALLDFLADSRIGLDWMAYGGDSTLFSYGVGIEGPRSQPSTMERARHQLRRNLPDRHLAFLRDLKPFHEEGDYFFAHAGVRPGVALAAQRLEDLLWIREPFLSSGADFGKVVVHGHSISPRPEERPNRIGIDTGAFMSGCLTALVLEGESRRFLQTDG